jgi:hypothetical protein
MVSVVLPVFAFFGGLSCSNGLKGWLSLLGFEVSDTFTGAAASVDGEAAARAGKFGTSSVSGAGSEKTGVE